MSATVDAVSLKNFFNNKHSKSETEDTATVLSVEGRLYPVTVHYINGIELHFYCQNVCVLLFINSGNGIAINVEPIPDYVVGVVDCVCAIHKEELEGDILAFLTGSEEVDRAVAQIKEQINEASNKYCKYEC